MSIRARISDDEPTAPADLILKIDYDSYEGSAARVFEIVAELIHSLEDLDRVLAQSIDSELETALFVEDLQKSSIKVFIKNILKGLPDEAIKEVDVKKVVGHYLLKAKYAALEWLDTPEEENPRISDLTERVARLAADTDVRRLPDYPPPNPGRIAQPLQRLQDLKKRFGEDESLTITLGKDEYSVKLDRTWSPAELASKETSEQILENEDDLFLVIHRPDFIGNAKWSLKHGKRTLSLKIEDEAWLESFRSGSFPLRPGDALRVRLRTRHVYDERGNLTESDESIVRVYEVIAGQAGRTDDLFEGG